ncbi:MAG: hypothetical protein HGA78_11580, partial [Nitrospirales bacterium]|nr:hypothetical protein [Nitrospirales bacterium]
MKRNFVFFLTLIVSVVLFAGIALADFLDRIATQQQRINQGIASGSLTRGEADTLQDNLNWIKFEYIRMKADGRLSPGEQDKLDKMIDRNSLMIENKKHNPISRVYQADIPERIANQEARIDQGIRSGELTRAEADTLIDNLNWIK